MTCTAAYLIYIPVDKFRCFVIIPGDLEAISDAGIFFNRHLQK